jgi:hypothetical protein
MALALLKSAAGGGARSWSSAALATVILTRVMRPVPIYLSVADAD